MGRFLAFIAVFFSLSVFAQTPEECVGAAAVLVNERPAFAKWAFTDASPPQLEAKHFLPEFFLAELGTKFTDPRIATKLEDGKQLNLRLTVKDGKNERVIIHADLFADPGNPGNLIVEKLRLQNPLAEKAAEEGLSQRGKGLPLPVFRYARDQIFAMGKAGGFKQMKSATSSNYTVFALYDRIVQLNPETPAVKESIDMLEELKDFALKAAPEAYRAESMDDFARIIGEAGVPLNPAHAQAWAAHKAGRDAPGFQLLKSADGRVLGFVNDFADRPKEVPAIVFLDKKTGEPIDFGEMGRSGRLALVAPL